MNETVNERIQEYVKLEIRRIEILEELSLEDAMYLFYALSDRGLIV